MNDTVTIGSLNPGHRQELEDIVRATTAFSAEEVGVALELFDEVFAADRTAEGEVRAATDYEFVGAFRDGRLVGYACFGLTPATDRTYDLYWIAVHPDAQRLGAGAVLTTEVERRLEERRARLLVVETSGRDNYAPARRFYERRGYTASARLRDFYAPGDDRIILTKRLVEGGAGSAESNPDSPGTRPLSPIRI